MTVDNGGMVGRGGKRRWVAGGLLAGALVLFGLGRFLAGQHLDRADQWSSVISLFLTAAGLALAVSEAVRERRRATVEDKQPAAGWATSNTILEAQISGPVVQGRDMHRIDLAGRAGAGSPGAGAAGEQDQTAAGTTGDVTNRIEGGIFGGPVVQGRDVSDLILPQPASLPDASPGSGEGAGR